MNTTTIPAVTLIDAVSKFKTDLLLARPANIQAAQAEYDTAKAELLATLAPFGIVVEFTE